MWRVLVLCDGGVGAKGALGGWWRASGHSHTGSLDGPGGQGLLHSWPSSGEGGEHWPRNLDLVPSFTPTPSKQTPLKECL